MDNTFTRALLGFLALTVGLAAMAAFALWGIDRFGGSTWWAGLIVVIIAIAAEISIYMSTLHDPIGAWIREPERRQREEDKVSWLKTYVKQSFDDHLAAYHQEPALE